jgi:hypothetical protein
LVNSTTLSIVDIIGSVIALASALIAIVITGIATILAGKDQADIYCIVPGDNTNSFCSDNSSKNLLFLNKLNLQKCKFNKYKKGLF